MSNTEDIVEGLLDRNLFLLADILDRSDETYSRMLFRDVRRELGVDIGDVNSIYKLTDDEISKLKQFEIDKKDYYIESLKDRTPGTKKEVTDNVKLINFKYRLATILISLSLLYVFAITFAPIPEDNRRFVDTTVGMIISMVLSVVVSHFFHDDGGDDNNGTGNKKES